MGEYRIKNSKTFRLFAVPSFFSGIASSFDLFPNSKLINESETTTEADMKALKADFEMTGKDIREAINEWEKDYFK
ncbi:MAG: hypothetical protein WBI17_02290 [Clostridiaceae bacterium]